MPVVSLSAPLTLDVIEEIAAQVIADLERDALRTIRQKDTEKGKAMLDQIDGVQHFLESLRLTANSSFYRQLHAAQQNADFTRNRSAVKKPAGKG
jgi:4-hydroxyphenylpyruvate dioxygenase-like putative hemolysin